MIEETLLYLSHYREVVKERKKEAVSFCISVPSISQNSDLCSAFAATVVVVLVNHLTLCNLLKRW